MLKSKVQLAPPTKNVKMALLTPKSVIQLVFKAFGTGRKLSSACCNYVHFSHQPLTSVAQKINFSSLLSNNSHTMLIFIIFSASSKMMMTMITNTMWKTCWDFLTKTSQVKGLIKDSRNFAILDYWKLWLFKNETK